jgi:hypothetical protein
MSAPDKRASIRLPYRELLLLFFGSRVFIYVVAALGLAGIGKGPHFRESHTVMDWFLRWDAWWYIDVIEHGYRAAPDASLNVGYFPLYPWIARAFTLGGLINTAAAGTLAALAGLWLACVALWRLVHDEWNDAALATTSVAFLLVSPVGFFFSALYSESWFLALSIGCFVAARRRGWWLAGLLGALAALTRFVGVALIVPLVWEFVETHRRAAGVPSSVGSGAGGRAQAQGGWWPGLACLLPLAGYGTYCVIMWAKFGNPLMYSVANAESGRHFTWFWGLFARPSFTGLPAFYQIWFAGAVLIALGTLTVGVLLRMPHSFAILVLTYTGIYLSARFVDSLPRYFAGLFPFYVALALLARWRPALAVPLLSLCAALLAFSVVLFVNGYWFT